MSTVNPLADLTDAQLDSLRSAAVWYANYHAAEVAELAGDGAAYAVEERRQYLELVGALEKLGVKVRVPDRLLELQRQAA